MVTQQATASGRPDVDALRRLIDRLDGARSGGVRPDRERRSSRRFVWPTPALVMGVEHPGGGSASFVVVPRNVSTRGLAVAHTSFVHLGARCQVALPVDGGTRVVTGVIVGCRLLEGTAHEIRMRFDVPIDVGRVDGLEHARPARVDAGFDPAGLHGQVLLLDDVEVQARLFGFHLASTNVALVNVATLAQARAALTRHRFDMVLADVGLDGESSLGVIRKLRAAGAACPIVAVTADTRESRLAEIEWAGADAVLVKPHTAAELFGLLERWLPQGRAPEAALCTWPVDEHNRPLVEHYIEYARGTAARLETLLEGDDLAACRAICLTIKGAAPGYGFPHLGRLAATAVETIDETGCGVRSSAPVREVARLCRQLQIGEAMELRAAA